MNTKKWIMSILTGCMMLGLMAGLTGCAKEPEEDPNTLSITMLSSRDQAFIAGMKEAFPDINFDIDYYQGEDNSDFLSSVVKSGEGGDLMFNTIFTTQPEYTQNMLDLSGYSFIGNIREEIIDMISVEDAVYFVPSPLDVRCVVYNKTMFEEYGWKVPENHEELIALVKQIRQEAPEITPIGMSARGAAYSFTTITTYAQCGFLSTPDGYKWEQEFLAGNASFEEGMDEGITVVEELIDAGAFDPEKFADMNYVDIPFSERECAMVFEWPGLAGYNIIIGWEEVTDEFGFLPFYGLNGEKLFAHGIGASLAINRKLGEEGNEEKLANALRVLEWFASPEGQELMKTDSTQLSITKDLDNDAAMAMFAELMELSADGYTASMLYSGYEDIIGPVGDIVLEAAYNRSSEGMREKIVETADTLQKSKVSGDSSVYYGEAAEHFTNEETAQFVADALAASGLGDFALITHTGMKDEVINAKGAAGRIHAGLFSDIQNLIISSGRLDNAATLDLTGAQIKTLLENGKPVDKVEVVDEVENVVATTNFDYFWSGIDVNMKEGKVTSVKLNGKELEDDTTYTVVFQTSDYPAEYAEEALLKEGHLMLDIVSDYVSANTPIKAPEVLRK